MAHHNPSGHEKIETSNFLMIVLILVTVAFGGLVEIVPPLHLIVVVAGAFRKQPSERIDVGRNPFRAEACRQAAIEKTGGRVRRPIEAVWIGAEGLVLVCKRRAQIGRAHV